MTIKKFEDLSRLESNEIFSTVNSLSSLWKISMALYALTQTLLKVFEWRFKPCRSAERALSSRW